jgi:RNA polymerase sigma factor (sigma-70 family)
MANTLDKANGASFLITIRSQPKHGILYALSRHYGGIVPLAEATGIGKSSICWWINLRKYPRRAFCAPSEEQRANERARIDAALAKVGTSIDECWPPEVRQFIDRTQELKSLVYEETQEVPLKRLTGSIIKRLTVDDDVSQGVEQEELQKRLRSVLKTLPYREREIIKLRYGLDCDVAYTLEETAHIFKLTRERVRQIEMSALRKLQQPSRAGQLAGHMD